MQETEHSVPFEGLAGNIPFQGLRRPPAVSVACVVARLMCKRPVFTMAFTAPHFHPAQN